MIQNYGELKTEIANWLDREDQTDNIPGYIRLAETAIYRGLRTRENEFVTTLSLGDAPVTLPQNFREVKLLTLGDQVLKNVSSQKLFSLRAQNYASTQIHYALIGQELYVEPAQSPAVDATMIYYGTESIGEMSTWNTPSNPNSVPESDGTPSDTTERNDEATTRLLLVAPDAYLFGALVQAYRLLREPAKMAEYQQHFNEAMAMLVNEHDEAEFAGSTSRVDSVYYDGRVA